MLRRTKGEPLLEAPGGKVGDEILGETLGEALKRELREELGIEGEITVVSHLVLLIYQSTGTGRPATMDAFYVLLEDRLIKPGDEHMHSLFLNRRAVPYIGKEVDWKSMAAAKAYWKQATLL